MTQFWHSHPALLYGLSLLLGIFFYFEPFPLVAIPLLALWIPFLMASSNRYYLIPLILSLLTFFAGWSYSKSFHSFPLLPEGGVQGQAAIKIKNIGLQHSFFGERWIYRCEIVQFIPENSSVSIASSLPCLISFPSSEFHPRPLAYQDYWLTAKLVSTSEKSYLLKVSQKAHWLPIEGTWSLAEKRYQWKRVASHWIETHFSHPLSASFLSGLVTGEFDDPWMRHQFSRFGLQHLLAISGFHFAIIAAFLSFILTLLFSQKYRIILLLLFLGAYCLFLGPQPSILRAWMMCSLTLAGGLVDKQTTALNSLGLALLFILGYDPLLCKELGFQLSFATTAAILLFYQPASRWLYELLPKRTLGEVSKMNLWHQHGYCILAFFRQSLALSLAVNIFALPMTLFYFNQFPLMSLLYNLFYPFLASASICLLLLGTLFSFIPFLADLIHHLNDGYTYFLLQLTYQVPPQSDTFLTVDSFPSLWLILYLCVTSVIGIIWKEKQTEEKFSFI